MHAPIRRGVGGMLWTWPFVLSLATLIANDFWFKASYPGLITGKLSDFAGVAVVALLALAKVSRPLIVYACITAAFAWWKGSLSQPLIEAINSLSPIFIARTVDYWDLLALFVMPACALVARRQEGFKLPGETVRRLLRAPLIAATAFAVMATPAPRAARMEQQVRTFQTSGQLKRGEIARALAEVAARHRLKCIQCNDPDVSASYGNGSMYLDYTFVDGNTLSLRTHAQPHDEKGIKKLDRLALDIKQNLRKIQPGLEYTERILEPVP